MQVWLTSLDNITCVRVPPVLYSDTGNLKLEYARVSETVQGYPDEKKLHLNEDGQAKVVYCITRAISKTAKKRIR